MKRELHPISALSTSAMFFRAKRRARVFYIFSRPNAVGGIGNGSGDLVRSHPGKWGGLLARD